MSGRPTVLAASVLTVLALAGVSACSSGSGSTGQSSGTPTVKLMVGGIDKQIYLPYELAQKLGFYKKYGVDVQLSTEQNGGVGAEEAMASGQVDMAGAWYNHTIEFQAKGKAVEDVVQLSGAPGEREMCTKASGVTSGADFKGKTLGVTDLGSGTDTLTQFLAAKMGVKIGQFHRIAVGAGSTAVAALQKGKVDCVMTTQPTVAAIEKKGVGVSSIDLATTAGTTAAMGGAYPAAGVLARTDWVASHKDTVQKVVDALVATMHWINTHSAADIADKLPPSYVSNQLVTKADYITALTEDKGQFLPDGIMPAGGPKTSLATEELVGDVKGSVDLGKTFTNAFAVKADRTEGIRTTTPPAGSNG
ncbi:ABC transporter substrate-binding protein [Streptomyces sp. YU58]|uniref:ABC transporter substrate-binding protein n=1 Tax=Streptomyces sp. SX92 TaxID=3158972 RepID=UPI0027B8A533|nr:ABC transporter substrate-binding protein [Streptomyces coralus]WLW55311.1 ABC transporter substrate-binding protein [Streptomyces coralus]